MAESISGRPVVDVIEGGLELYSADDRHIGHVAEINPDFLIVQAPEFGQDYLYIPRDAQEREEDGRIYLSTSYDEIGQQGWNQGGWDGSQTDTGYADVYENQSSGASQAGGYQTQNVSPEGSTVIRRYEEELQAQKTARQVGEVGVRKDVVEEQQSFEVPVMREEVEIRRRPVDAASADATGAADAFTQEGDTIRVPIVEEEVQVTKTPRVVEELEISKRTVQGTEQVSDTVRKERIDVDEQGQARVDRSDA